MDGMYGDKSGRAGMLNAEDSRQRISTFSVVATMGDIKILVSLSAGREHRCPHKMVGFRDSKGSEVPSKLMHLSPYLATLQGHRTISDLIVFWVLIQFCDVAKVAIIHSMI
jgi:hypothetical protein